MSASSSVFLKASPLALALLALAVPEIARADDSSPVFEGRGRVILSDVLGIRSAGMGYLSMMAPGYGTPAMTGLVSYSYLENVNAQSTVPIFEKRQTFSVNPSLDVFVSRRVTLGASLGFAQGEVSDTGLDPYSQSLWRTEQHSVLFGVAPRVGYVVPLGRGFSLWPRVGLAYSRTRTTVETVTPKPAYGGYAVSEQIAGGADLGLVFQPTRHLYLSAGPELSVASNHAELQQGSPAFYATDFVTVRMAGSLTMGLIL